VDLSAGHGYTCVVVDGGDVRCWGTGQGGRLGYASRDDVLSATAAGVVDVGGRVRAIEAGPSGVTCAVMVSGSVRCWGQNVQGTLGNASTQDVGAMDTPASAGDVALPGKVLQVGVGAVHVCAVLEGGRVRCWGYGAHGRLGYPVEGNIGDDETPAEGRDVDVGGRVSAIAAGGSHTCALLESGSVRCWGEGNHGQLGYGYTRHVGEEQTPAQAGDVPLGTIATRIAAGAHHTCALLESGEVMCWGRRIDGVMSSLSPTRVRFDTG
jgi:alpha-tubulin suppressor-like RCC1 family protein